MDRVLAKTGGRRPLWISAVGLALGVWGASFAGDVALWAWMSGAIACLCYSRSRWLAPVFLGASLWSVSIPSASLPAGVIPDDRFPDVVSGTVIGDRIGLADGGEILLRWRGPGRPRSGERVRIRGRVVSLPRFRGPGTPRVVAIHHQISTSAPYESLDTSVSVRGLAERMQATLAAQIIARADGVPGRLVAAMSLGDRKELSPDVAAAFRQAGAGHLLAVSGLHLSAVAWLSFACARGLAFLLGGQVRRRSRTVAACCALCAATAFALISGARPSAVRALAVVGVLLLGVATNRRARLGDALAVAAIGMLLHNPLLLWEPSAQLSFAAVIALAMDPGGRARPTGRLRRLLGLLRATLVASLATAPIAAHHFAAVPTLGLLSNLFALPLVECVVVPCGLLGALVSVLCPPIGGLVIDVATLAAALVWRGVDLFAGAFPEQSVFPLSLAEIAVCWSILLVMLLWRYRPAQLWAALTLTACLVWTRVGAGRDKEMMSGIVTVAVVDVGHGDAYVVEFSNGAVWLIDGGPKAGARPLARYFDSRRIDRIDVFLVTHPHPDHYAGVLALRSRVDIGELWTSLSPADDSAFTGFVDTMRGQGTRIAHPVLGFAHTVGSETVTVYGPRRGPGAIALYDPVLSPNDNSLAVVIRQGDHEILFPGDMGSEGESLLLERWSPTRVAVAAVPHHGSRTSSSPEFVARVRPAVAVISQGRANPYGLPAQEIVDRYRAVRSRVVDTGGHGTSVFRVARDGNVRVQPYREPTQLRVPTTPSMAASNNHSSFGAHGSP